MKEASARAPPYPWWYHPDKTWLDIVLTKLLDFFNVLQFHIVTTHTIDSEAAVQEAQSLRSVVSEHSLTGFRKKVRIWQSRAGCNIAEAVYSIPWSATLWSELDMNHSTLENMGNSYTEIPVYLFFPVNLLEPSATEDETFLSDTGCQPFHLKSLSDLPEDATIVIYFHGGALICGDVHDESSLKCMVECLGDPAKPVVIASVEMGLAPERTFPGPTAEAVTVVAHVLGALPGRRVHIHGCSAGGYYALIAAMECFRKYPGRIGSVLLQSPMLDPTCQSHSFHANGSSSWVPGTVIQWGWRAYLRNHGKDVRQDGMVDESQHWKGTSLERWVFVLDGLPPGLDGADALTIIVLTNRADPLHDDGKELVKRLREQSAKVIHLDHSGSHVLGTYFDRQEYKDMVETYRTYFLSS